MSASRFRRLAVVFCLSAALGVAWHAGGIAADRPPARDSKDAAKDTKDTTKNANGAKTSNGTKNAGEAKNSNVAKNANDAKDSKDASLTPKNVGDLRAIEVQIQKVVAKVRRSTVALRVGAGSGSGVIVSEDGLIMTAGHVVGKPGQPVTVVFDDGKTAKGTTLGAYVTADAGLVKITDHGKWPFVEKGVAARLQPGAWCVALGHPSGYQAGRPPVVRLGRVLRVQEAVILTDCPLVGGDSGGPLFSLDGKLIGINSRIGGTTDLNLHVPVDVFRENWRRLVNGETWQDDVHGRGGSQVKAAFGQALAEAGASAVRVKCDGEDTVLGTIVGPDGWIVTKASELSGKVVCCLPDKREFAARIVGVCPPFDLAMLKIDATQLPVAPWSKTPPAVGQWLAAVGPGGEAIAVGVLSVPQRRIPPAGGVLGVAMNYADDEAQGQLERVFPNSAAEKAGLKEGDTVVAVDGKTTPNAVAFIAAVKEHRPGETVTINVKRGETTMAVTVVLGGQDPPPPPRRDSQGHSGLAVSKRHDDFPTVLQHDAVLRPADCGGPLVDLSGKVVGVNIARGGRTETYCVPSEVLLSLMYDLMSGQLGPDRMLAEKAPAEKAAGEKHAAEEKAVTNGKGAETKVADEKIAEKKAAEPAAGGKQSR